MRTISIVFNIKDKPLALHICMVLGTGSIQTIKNKNAINLVIRSKEGILKIISLINGKFRTPKISSLHKLINWINENPNYNKDKSK